MRVPRQWLGADLKKALAALGYEETRQTGSHVRLTTQMRGVTSSHCAGPQGASSGNSQGDPERYCTPLCMHTRRDRGASVGTTVTRSSRFHQCAPAVLLF